jgi:large subunit ribosomal protein L34
MKPLNRFGGAIMIGTYQPNNRKKSKKHGFFARKGSKILKQRRKRGRKVLCR